MNQSQVNAQFEALFKGITARQAVSPSRDNEIALSLMHRAEKGIKHGMLKFSVDVFSKYVAMQSETNKTSDNFIAVKANVKVLNMLYAIGNKMLSHLDEYSQTIIANAFKNENTLFAKSALVCLSKGIEYTEFDVAQVIKYRMRKAESTASTQRSSSREMLRVLNLAEIHKRIKGDNITLTEKGQTILKPFFSDETDETESVDSLESVE